MCTFCSAFLLFFSATLPSLAHDTEEKALEFGRLDSRLPSTNSRLCDPAQNFLSVPQFPRLKNERSNTVNLLLIVSAAIISCR